MMRIFSPSVTIFTVHGLVDDVAAKSWQPLRTYHNIRAFEESLRALKIWYRFVPLSDAVEMVSGRRPMLQNAAVLTFDDGYQSILSVMDLLQREAIVPTIFIATGYVETDRLYWWDRLDYIIQKVAGQAKGIQIGEKVFSLKRGRRNDLKRTLKAIIVAAKRFYGGQLDETMDCLVRDFESQSGHSLQADSLAREKVAILKWQEIARLSARGVIIGSHTVNHSLLSYEKPDSQWRQLVDSKRIIEQHLDIRCTFLAYPSGDHDENTTRMALQCGYVAAVTTIEGKNKVASDLMRLKRIVFPSNSK